MANEKSDSRQWFLRIAGGTVFGPVSTKGLIVWAERGQVGPGCEVSTDRAVWVPAQTVPELEMKWYLSFGSRIKGPFNRAAVEGVLKSGKAPADAKLVEAGDVDRDALARSAVPDEERTPEVSPAPAAKPAAGRHVAVKSDAPREPETDARDRRIAEIEAALEKQRETVALGKQAAKVQAALERERDELRQQMQELQAQMENLRSNAEKDAQKRERKLESLKQELARLQEEQEAARSRPMLKLAPVEEAPTPGEEDDPRQAFEELRRQAEDERHAWERDAELLRARVREREETCEKLQKELADAPHENQELRTRAAALDQRVAELASQVGQIETERNKLADEREKLQHQLGVAMSEATDATNEAANGELRRRVEQIEAVNEGLRTELAQADQELAAGQSALAELLAASNERDVANQQRIEELQNRQADLEAQLKELGTASERETRLSAELATARSRIAEVQGRIARLPETPAAIERAAHPPEDAEAWLRQFAMDELTSLDKGLHEERESFNAFRQLSTTRQEAIQARIQTIQRLLSGDHSDGRTRTTTPGHRISGLDQSRLQNEVETLRVTQQREVRQFEEREAELLRRVRVLETEETRLRSLLEATDMEGGKKIELMETIRRREQELAQERRNREQDREQFEAEQHALRRRTEELERGAPPMAETSASGEPRKETAGAAKSLRPTGIASWLKR